MPIGITTDVLDGVAVVTFDDPALRGRALAALSTLGLLHEVKIDTGGPRRRYRMSVTAAEAAGLLDLPKPAPKAKAAPKTAKTTKAKAETKAKADAGAAVDESADAAAWV